MKKWIFYSAFVLSGFFTAAPAYAYIDPGTTGTLGGALAAIFPALAVILGLLIRPFKKGARFLWKKLKK